MQMRKHYQLKDIKSADARKRLEPRTDPYWVSVGTGRAIGFRKTGERGTDIGAWFARWTEPYLTEGTRKKYRQGALKNVVECDDAIAAAQAFFVRTEREWKREQHSGDEIEDIETVEQGVKSYVTNLRAKKGDDPANHADGLFKKTVYDKPFGKIPLANLDASHVNQWLLSLVKGGKRKGRTANRIFRQLKAALNHVKGLNIIDSDNAWKNVKAFNDADGRRNAHLKPAQLAAVLAACERKKDARELMVDPDLRYCTPDLAKLTRAALITGARPGELAKAKVSDYDTHTGTLTLHSSKNKEGISQPREFYLTDADREFFNELARDKLPSTQLITRADGTSWVYDGGKMHGVPRRREWAAGLRAAVRIANKHLPKELRIPVPAEQSGRTTMYTARHTAITDMLDSGIQPFAVTDAVGTSERMLKEHYDQHRKNRVREELAKRKAL